MKYDLIKMAKLLSVGASEIEKEALNRYVTCLEKDKMNSARIIADELFEYFLDKLEEHSVVSKKRVFMSRALYDQTLEYIELKY